MKLEDRPFGSLAGGMARRSLAMITDALLV